MWDDATQEWVTELPAVRDGVSGVDVVVELNPDAEFTYTYTEMEINPETGLMEEVQKTRTDWCERRKIFVAEGGNVAQILSNAAWDHYLELNKRFSTTPPLAPNAVEEVARPRPE